MSASLEPLRRRLAARWRLPAPDWAAFAGLSRRSTVLKAGETLIEAGTPARRVFVLTRGLAARTRILETGRRQIVNLMTPGDLFDLQAVGRLEADHSVVALGDIAAESWDGGAFMAHVSASAPLLSAFWWASVQEEAFLREQTVRLGRRPAAQRMAHLFCELRLRLVQAGVADEDDALGLSLRREDVADALGLTAIHVSRCLTGLQKKGLIARSGRLIRLPDPQALADFSGFDAAYFHNPALPDGAAMAAQ